MSATKALMTTQTLSLTLTNAVVDAMKMGLAKDDVIAVLARIQEILESSEDDSDD